MSTSSASTTLVAVEAELDLGVGDEDAALGGDLVAPREDRRRSGRAPRRARSAPISASTSAYGIGRSCSPIGAFVVGVKIGSGSREPSTSPSGSATPET